MSLTSSSNLPFSGSTLLTPESTTPASKPASAAAKALAKRRGKKPPTAPVIEASVAQPPEHMDIALTPAEEAKVVVSVSTPEATHEVTVSAPTPEAAVQETPPAATATSKVSRTQWYDLAASPIKGTVKPGSVLFHTIALLRHTPTPTLGIQAMLDSCSTLKQKHSAIKLMRWASNNRGYGFRLDLATNLIHLVD